MNVYFRTTLCLALSASIMMAVAAAQPPSQSDPQPNAVEPTITDSADAADQAPQQRVSVELARDRAALMHDLYAATLEVIHDRYFHADRAIIPARAMEDVFAEMRRQSGMEARWIGVSFRPMSVNNEAETDFEKRAKKEIATGKSQIEEVEGGFYRRAGAIPLGSNCISCHDGFFRQPHKKPRFAALVISVPIHAESVVAE